METFKFLLTSSFYPPYHIGGDAVYVKYLSEGLANRGHEVHVLHSLDAYRIKRKNVPKTITYKDVNIHAIKTCFNNSAYSAYLFGKSFSATKKFDTLIRQVKPDVVHHNNISLLGYDLFRKRDNYINLYTAHDYWLICAKNNLIKHNNRICKNQSCIFCVIRSGKPPQFWRCQNEFRKVVSQIDLLISPSNFLRNKISNFFNIKCTTIPNFVPEPPNNVRHMDLAFNDFFLYAGVLETHKGVLDLIKVFKKLELDSKLLIVGEGSLKEKILKFVRNNFLEDKVVIFGHVNKNLLYSLMNEAKALIVPSKWPENCPLVAIEAISLGTPVIASNIGGLPEIVKKIDYKLLFNSFEELNRILLDYNKNKYIKYVKNVYNDEFTFNNYYKKYMYAIKSFIN